MKKQITINKKVYDTADITFDTICFFEECGIPLEKINERGFSVVRAYIALCMKTNIEKAGEELQEHIVNGGEFEPITEVLSEAIEQSAFFQALSTKEKKNA